MIINYPRVYIDRWTPEKHLKKHTDIIIMCTVTSLQERQPQLSVWITQQFVFTPVVLHSVWMTNGRELANHCCGVTASLCERIYLKLIGLDLDWKLCHDSAFSHCKTGSWIWESRFQFRYVYRYSPSCDWDPDPPNIWKVTKLRVLL